MKKIDAALNKLQANTPTIQRVDQSPTSEGEVSMQRVAASPPIKTTTNPTAQVSLQAKPCTYQRKTRNNRPGSLPPIINPVFMGLPQQRLSACINPTTISKPFIINKEPNSAIIPMAHSHVISQEAVNLLTNRVYTDVSDTWLPDVFITNSPTSKSTDHYDIDIENICAAVVHP